MLLAEEKRKAQGEPRPDATLKLREYAKANKKPLAHFKDMGESEASTAGAPEYMVACLFAEREEVGVGSDKSSARSAAAEKMLNALTKKQEKKQTAKKPTPKRVGKKPRGVRIHNNKKTKA